MDTGRNLVRIRKAGLEPADQAVEDGESLLSLR